MVGPKKKICFVVAVPMTASAFLLKHFETLSERFDLYLVANFNNGTAGLDKNPHLKGTFHAGIEREIKLFRDFKCLQSLTLYFLEMKFDAVLTVTPKAGFLGILAAKQGGIKNRIHIFTGQVWHTKKGLFRRILMAIDRLTFQLSTQVLVDGKAQREFLIESQIVTADRAQVLGRGSISGVDTDRFVPDESIRHRWRTELGYTEKDLVFMFLGRLNVDKGILDLARAFEKLVQERPESRLLLVGFDEENLMPQINQMITDGSKVHFYGPTPKPYELLQACDVFCLPSYREGFGSSVIEASLLEKPVLCSDTYGLKETIVENKTGLRHKTADAEDIHQQMRILAADTVLRKSMGTAGRTYVLENFTAGAITGEWLRFFTQLLVR